MQQWIRISIGHSWIVVTLHASLPLFENNRVDRVKLMILKRWPLEVWSDKSTEIIAELRKLCIEKMIDAFMTDSETKSAFAQGNVRSLKRISYKYLQHGWTYHYSKNLNLL